MPRVRHFSKKLGPFLATAICGNDILSSSLYVSGIAILFAGFYAPFVLLTVAGVLYFYRAVYREVVEALPVNGGVYNILLNASSKSIASLAGVMSILSLLATAVLSAKMAVTYFASVLPVFGITTFTAWETLAVIGILSFSILLALLGVKDSARVAAGIFVFHLVTLSSFVLLGFLFILTYGPAIANLNTLTTQALVAQNGGMLKTLFFAFSASLLSISGFQSSANYIEAQQHGVFAKTLRNMALGAAIFNPTIAAIALYLLPIKDILASQDFLLAHIGAGMGGTFFLVWIATDAFLVLSGAVLSSSVGAIELFKRMTLDGCFPSKLLRTPHESFHVRIAALFFALCVSLLLITNGDLLSLAGMYVISFLGVMSLFAMGNLIMRRTRPELHRPYRAPFYTIIIALGLTLVGLMGNIALEPQNTGYFLTYFFPAMLIVFSALYRKDVYETLARMTRAIPRLHTIFTQKYEHAKSGRIYVFIHHLHRLSPILDYIRKNETTTHITLVHCQHHHPDFMHDMQQALATLQTAGFFRDYEYAVEFLDEPFSPKTLLTYAKHKHIPTSRIFMGSIRHEHAFTYEDLIGVRIIF